MGTFQHNAIIATTGNYSKMEAATKWIRKLSDKQRRYFEFSPIMRNDFMSIVMWPDGSKEGWDVSNDCDNLRRRFIDEVLKPDSWEWMELSYGERGHAVLGSSAPKGEREELAAKVENTIANHWGFIGRVKMISMFLLPPDYSSANSLSNIEHDEAVALLTATLNRLKQRKVNGS